MSDRIRLWWRTGKGRPRLAGLVAAALGVAGATLLVRPLDALVPVNSLVEDYRELRDVPVRVEPGGTVYVRDVADVIDGTDVATGYGLVNGRRSVYILVTKRADASTLAVVSEVKRNIPRMQRGLHSRGCEQILLAGEQEKLILNMHRELDRYLQA